MLTSVTVAVLRAFDQPLVPEEASVPNPEPGAVATRVAFGGVCGTDVYMRRGILTTLTA